MKIMMICCLFVLLLFLLSKFIRKIFCSAAVVNFTFMAILPGQHYAKIYYNQSPMLKVHLFRDHGTMHELGDSMRNNQFCVFKTAVSRVKIWPVSSPVASVSAAVRLRLWFCCY